MQYLVNIKESLKFKYGILIRTELDYELIMEGEIHIENLNLSNILDH